MVHNRLVDPLYLGHRLADPKYTTDVAMACLIMATASDKPSVADYVKFSLSACKYL